MNYTDTTGLECDDETRENLTNRIKRFIHGDPDATHKSGQKGIKRRWNEQVYGKYGPDTPEFIRLNGNLEQEQRGLRKLLDEWDNNDCGDPPDPDARKWADRGPVTENDYIGDKGTVKRVVIMDGKPLVVTVGVAALLTGLLFLGAPIAAPVGALAFLGVVLTQPVPAPPPRPTRDHVRSRIYY